MSERLDEFDDGVERALARAVFPAVDPAAVGRLAGRWGELRGRPGRRVGAWWWSGGAAAAVVAIAVGMWWVARVQNGQRDPVVVKAEPGGTAGAVKPVVRVVAVRAPTELERLLVASVPVRRAVVGGGRLSGEAEGLIAGLAASRVADREAAARELGGMDDPMVTRRLIAMARAGPLRREAVMALSESKEAGARAFIAGAREDRVVGPVVKALAAAAGGDGQL